MRREIAIVWVGLLLFLQANAAVAQGTPKPACPSLDGEWFGQFDGSYSGDWSATFAQNSNTIRAEATISVESGQPFEAEGSAGVTCEGSKTALAGSGSAKDKSGSFSGVSDDKGMHLTGTWWSGDLAGSWRGQRVKGDSPQQEEP